MLCVRGIFGSRHRFRCHFLVRTLYLGANWQKEFGGQLPDDNFYTFRDFWQFDCFGLYLCFCTLGAPGYNSPELDFYGFQSLRCTLYSRVTNLQHKHVGQHPDQYCALSPPVADLQKDDFLGL